MNGVHSSIKAETLRHAVAGGQVCGEDAPSGCTKSVLEARGSVKSREVASGLRTLGTWVLTTTFVGWGVFAFHVTYVGTFHF
jgi:hypothetical protein